MLQVCAAASGAVPVRHSLQPHEPCDSAQHRRLEQGLVALLDDQVKEQVYHAGRAYRLHDFWTGFGPFANYSSPEVASYVATYPGSLVARYHRSALSSGCTARRCWCDVERLAALVPAVVSPEERATISSWCSIHVRVGDVVECEARSVDDILREEQPSKRHPDRESCGPLPEGFTYVRSRDYYREALRSGAFDGCDTLHLVPGGLWPARDANASSRAADQAPKSLAYLSALAADWSCELGFQVELPPTASADAPDVDFARLALSRRFLSSGGGYSFLVNTVRNATGRPMSVSAHAPVAQCDAGSWDQADHN